MTQSGDAISKGENMSLKKSLKTNRSRQGDHREGPLERTTKSVAAPNLSRRTFIKVGATGLMLPTVLSLTGVSGVARAAQPAQTSPEPLPLLHRDRPFPLQVT